MDDLVKRLRLADKAFNTHPLEWDDLGKAADLIEAQAAEIERFRLIEHYYRHVLAHDWDRFDAVFLRRHSAEKSTA